MSRLLPSFLTGKGTVYTLQILHRLRDESVVDTWGKLDVSSGAIGLRSHILESRVDDSWWYQMTSSRLVEFDFGAKSQ